MFIKKNYNESELNNWVRVTIKALSTDSITEVLDNYDNLISNKRKKLLIKFITEKVKLLQGVFGGEED